MLGEIVAGCENELNYNVLWESFAAAYYESVYIRVCQDDDDDNNNKDASDAVMVVVFSQSGTTALCN